MDELIAQGLCAFTDLDDDHGTLDLDKCGEEARLYRAKRAVADRRLAAARKREAARAEAEADRLAKARATAAARRRETERLARRRLSRTETVRLRAGETSGGASKPSNARPAIGRQKKSVARENARRVAERVSERANDSGANMLMAAAALVASSEEVEVTDSTAIADASRRREKRRRVGGAAAKATARSPSSLPAARGADAREGAKTTRATNATRTTNATGTPSKRSKEERLAEEHREKFLAATAAAERAKRDAAAAKARADAAFEAARRLGDSPLARKLPSRDENGLASPARRVATKTSLRSRLQEATDRSPSSSAERASGDDDGGSRDAEEVDALGGGARSAPFARPAPPPAAPAPPFSLPGVVSEDNTRVETAETVETADVRGSRPAAGADADEDEDRDRDRDPTSSQTFAGATPTSWVARLLVSRMSADPTIRAVFLGALCAMEEKHHDFAERLLTEHDFECGWRFRLLEYLDRVRGRDASASERATRARRCEAREAAAREARRERDAREADAFHAMTTRGEDVAREDGKNAARPHADESDPFFDERPGAGLEILRRARETREEDDERRGAFSAAGTASGAVPAVPGERHAAHAKTAAFVKTSPERSASAAGVAPSGPLPARGASRPGTGALGAAFALFVDNAGASGPEDWRHMRRLAKRDAAARPTEALTLTLAGLLAWRAGDLEGARAPLRAAMHHDGAAARAAPLLFEVLLRLDETDEAEVVWDTALHRGESGPTYERLIAVALRCGEGGAGGEESGKSREGDSEMGSGGT